MSTFIITGRPSPEDPGDLSELRAPMFPAIFTDHRAAERFLDSMAEDGEIARLNAMQLLQWMVRVYEQGTHYLLVNPRTAWSDVSQAGGRLAIEQQLARFAELLTRDVVACTESTQQNRQVTGN